MGFSEMFPEATAVIGKYTLHLTVVYNPESGGEGYEQKSVLKGRLFLY